MEPFAEHEPGEDDRRGRVERAHDGHDREQPAMRERRGRPRWRRCRRCRRAAIVQRSARAGPQRPPVTQRAGGHEAMAIGRAMISGQIAGLACSSSRAARTPCRRRGPSRRPAAGLAQSTRGRRARANRDGRERRRSARRRPARPPRPTSAKVDGRSPVEQAPGDRHDRGADRRDRGDHAHSPDRQPPVEQHDPDRPDEADGHAEQQVVGQRRRGSGRPARSRP